MNAKAEEAGPPAGHQSIGPSHRGSDDGAARANAEELSKVMAALGRLGGRIGGKRRLETMSQEERSAVASKAARARWKKAKGKRR